MEAGGDNANLVMVAGLSMQSKISCNSILDQMLWEIDVYDSRKAWQSFPGKDDFEQRRFFAVPHNNLSGAIRLNLKNREAKGNISKGQEYDETIVLLKGRLLELVNSETGERIISEIILIADDYSGSEISQLPDLFVLWNRQKPISEVSSQYFDSIRIRIREVLETRSGDHVAKAALYSNLQVMTSDTGKLNAEDISSCIMSLITNSSR